MGGSEGYTGRGYGKLSCGTKDVEVPGLGGSLHSISIDMRADFAANY